MGLVYRSSARQSWSRVIPHEQVAGVGIRHRHIACAVPRIPEHSVTRVESREHLLHVRVLLRASNVAIITVAALHSSPFIYCKLCYPAGFPVTLLQALRAGEDFRNITLIVVEGHVSAQQ